MFGSPRPGTMVKKCKKKIFSKKKFFFWVTSHMRGSLGPWYVYYNRPLTPLINPYQYRAKGPRMASPGPDQWSKKCHFWGTFLAKNQFFFPKISNMRGLDRGLPRGIYKALRGVPIYIAIRPIGLRIWDRGPINMKKIEKKFSKKFQYVKRKWKIFERKVFFLFDVK